MPAADLSEQISTAGTEALGHRQHEVRAQRRADHRHARRRQHRDPRPVGADNIFIFGHTTPEIAALNQGGYQPLRLYRIEPGAEGRARRDLRRRVLAGRARLLPSRRRGRPAVGGDHYKLLADYESYVAAQARVDDLFRDGEAWSGARSPTSPAWAASPPTARSTSTRRRSGRCPAHGAAACWLKATSSCCAGPAHGPVRRARRARRRVGLRRAQPAARRAQRGVSSTSAAPCSRSARAPPRRSVRGRGRRHPRPRTTGLRVQWQDGSDSLIDDPYRFGPVPGDRRLAAR